MTEPNTTEQHIWNPDTGILDIEGDVAELSASEIPGIRAIWEDQRARLKGSNGNGGKLLNEFTEKLSREWAIETGVIENLYEIERGITLTLIEHGLKAELLSHGSTNKPRAYVIQLLNDQKDALDGVFDFVKRNRNLSVSYIKELHAALLRSQETVEVIDPQGRHVEVPLIKGEWKDRENYPKRNGVIYKYCPPEQVASEMERLVEMHEGYIKNQVSTEVRAAWLHHRFTQIHPFQDGNGRVVRAIASLVLVQDGLFPLVVTRDDKNTYISALEDADNGNLKPLIDLITKLQITQFRKASAISEELLVEEGVQAALDGLNKAADRLAAERLEELKEVFDLAHLVEKDIEDRLEAIIPDVKSALRRVDEQADAWVVCSNENTDYYFRSQIIENAKKYLEYFADTSEYRAWVRLNMRWTRRSQLVFAIHGVGKPFNGSLICAPFLEFKDTDEDGQVRTALTPITEEGFVFFYNEDKERLLKRFLPWRERMIQTALNELTQNL